MTSADKIDMLLGSHVVDVIVDAVYIDMSFCSSFCRQLSVCRAGTCHVHCRSISIFIDIYTYIYIYVYALTPDSENLRRAGSASESIAAQLWLLRAVLAGPRCGGV